MNEEQKIVSSELKLRCEKKNPFMVGEGLRSLRRQMRLGRGVRWEGFGWDRRELMIGVGWVTCDSFRVGGIWG